MRNTIPGTVRHDTVSLAAYAQQLFPVPYAVRQFQENQASIAASLSSQKTSDEEHRARVQAEHREILNGLERIESR